MLVGDGPARLNLGQRMAGLPVHFAGYLHGQDLATAYASADLFVFPSDTETFGQVIQEAMASALPVVAARAGGALDLVRPGIPGACLPLAAPRASVKSYVNSSSNQNCEHGLRTPPAMPPSSVAGHW
ncbi:MAG: hypothetical protein Fur005_22690 [Roseiflexaceae bacterium]